MKIKLPLVLAIVALATSPSFAQGKGNGGGNAGAGNSGIGKGGGFDRPSASPAAVPRPVTPDATPNRRADRPSRNDAADLPRGKSHGAGKNDRSAAPAAQDLASSMRVINQTAFAQRRELHATLDMRLKSSREALKKIQTDAKDLRADARADFKAALADVKNREAELASAVKASKKADESRWNGNRDALSRAYQNHADAMARLEAIPRPPTPRLP